MRRWGIGLAIILLCSCRGTEESKQSTAQETKAELMAAELESVEKSAAMNLRDPDSAKFRNVRRFDHMMPGSPATDISVPVYCGEVNGKNAFGAYAGFQKFAVLAGTALEGKPASIWDDSEPGSAIAYNVFCEEDGKEREGGTPVELGSNREVVAP